MPKRKKKKIKGPNSKFAKPFNPDGYSILNTGTRKRLKGKRVLEDLTADPTKYQDNREPQLPGPTIRNSFKAYPWRDSSLNTVKG
ncbi:hypothetical protein GHL01_00275 [Sinorhizobium meliloti]|uniref:hypothetical protein n=1 Tax=Rhizobium meliloti TaxID=382 RepID=UPI001296D0C1|nr:hypothetical protein [Sinorhizobium meliloti]MQV12180.1 hypothetical protein [Sinorhizobium meliloti]